MNELIVIDQQKIGSNPVQTVNARDLHAFLGAKKMFSHWVKDRIEKYGFVENQDYVCLPVQASEGRGGNNRIDYHLTLGMAKELAMVEGNAKGKEARLYFLECERLVNQPEASIDLDDPAFLRQTLLTYTEKVIALENTVAEQRPKVEALDRISGMDGVVCITDAAKILGVKPKDLFAWMSARQWIYRRVGNRSWLAYQHRIQQGVLDHKVDPVVYADGSEKMRERVVVTAKGIAKLSEAFAETRVN